jgi:acyl-coenzyme A thioesterase PaaI-like protein
LTNSAISDHLRRQDPFVEYAGSRLLEADARHAVVEQRPAPELENHVGVRHAGALFAVGYAASRALVTAALGEGAQSAEVQMLDSEVVYEKAALGSVTATAEPAADDWDALLSRISEGQVAQLPTSVMLRNEDGKTVTSMTICWQAGPPGDGGSR